MDQIQEAWHRYDAAVSGYVFDTLYRLGYDEAKGPASPSTRGLPLMDSPTPQVTFVLGYLLIVFIGYTKHSIAPGRQKADPLWLKSLVQIHNVNLIVLSSYMSYTAAALAWKYSYRFWGQAYRPSERDMGQIIYIFYVSKLYEFVDTVSYAPGYYKCSPATTPSIHACSEAGVCPQFIMLLKGKLEQVSLLHVYHHASISTIW